MEKRYRRSNKQTRLRVLQPIDLMTFILQKMGGMSRNSAKSLLSRRQVQINRRIETHYNYMLAKGDEVLVSTSVANRELVHPKLKIVFEDDYLIVVEKKAGLLTVATMPESRESTVFSILKTYVKKSNPHNGIFVVHRLDRETSGLLVFAKSRDLQQFMRDNWRQVVTNRAYLAIVEGVVPCKQDTIVSWLTENPKTTRVYSSFTDNGGKKSITHYKRIAANEQYSLLELHLETGRTNQIRVQMASIGHPVVSDRKYGSGSSEVINNLALHAYVLEFEHPVTHQPLAFESVAPKAFKAVFN